MSREELPKALATWYDYTKWVLDRVDGFPKNQRFVLGPRLADAVVDVLELLAEAAYARGLAKADLLDRVPTAGSSRCAGWCESSRTAM